MRTSGTLDKILKIYADKGYAGAPNYEFIALNKIEDGIMSKDFKTCGLAEREILRSKAILKFRYFVEQKLGSAICVIKTSGPGLQKHLRITSISC